MTIRWEREPGSLRVVRVAPGAPAVPPQALAPAAAGLDARRTFHIWAEGIRASTAYARLAAGAVGWEHVRLARRLKGIGQRDLARELGIARSSIADAEGRRRPVHPKLAAWVTRVLREREEAAP